MEDLNLIVRMKFGSHLYGTVTEDSDVDLKGVYLPTERDILLSKVPKTVNTSTGDSIGKNTKHDVDIEIFPLHYFIQLACEGQTVALDMLHAPEEMIEYKTPVWDEILANRKMFYTKNLEAFVDYARRQASKYGCKGSRLAAIKSVIDELKKHDGEDKIKTIWESLPRGEHIHDDLMDVQKGLKLYRVCERSFHETVKVGYMLPILEKIYNEYGARAIQAMNNENIDWKAVSHAVRAALQVKELFLHNNITFPLLEADHVLKIKKGELDYTTEVVPYLESLMDELEHLSSVSKLPEQVEYAFWEDFTAKVIKKYVL